MSYKQLTPIFNLDEFERKPRFINGFYKKDILSVSQFSKDDLDYVFSRAKEMMEMVEKWGGTCDLLKGYTLACVFYEPSTRTSSSFIAAMERLGGKVIPITEGIQYSSVSKGESLIDSMITLEQYCDVIVLRHPQIGSSAMAAKHVNVPIINAGDGAGEHPTQALLDLFTIKNELDCIDGLRVAMVGDLRYGRTVHSLTQLLSQYDVSLRYVSPETLRLPMELMNMLIDKGIDVRESHKIEDVIETTDVLYVTRIQKERFPDITQYEEVKNFFVVDEELLKKKPKKR